MKTRAAIVGRKGGDLSIQEVDILEPGPGEVRVRVEACGVCRSDLHAIDGGESVRFPAVLGHEAAGVVDQLGPGVSDLSRGDRVILSWTPACGTCPACTRGEVQLCRDLRMSADAGGPLSWKGQGLDRFMALGAFAEHVVVPARMAVRIQGDIPATYACLIGCGVMTGFGASAKTGNVRWGETVSVVGCGGVGLAAIQGARVSGASRVFAIDPLPDRRDLALSIGATDVLDPSEAAARIAAQTDGGVDAAIECVGDPEAILAAFNMIRPGGRAIVVGLTALGDTLSIPTILLLTEKSIKGSIYGSANPQADFPKLVALWEEGRLALKPLVGATIPLARINDGVGAMRRGEVARVVVEFP